jgi:hypothetical protein
MIVVDRLLVGGLSFVLDKVAQAVDAEMDDPERWREELLAAQMRFELGEISEAELAGVEGEVMGKLRELRGEGVGGPVSFGGGGEGGGVGVEVEFGGDEEGHGDREG